MRYIPLTQGFVAIVDDEDFDWLTPTARFLGVSPSLKKWQASIGVDYKKVYLGTFETQEEAAKAYDEAAQKYFGEFANLNFKKPVYAGTY